MRQNAIHVGNHQMAFVAHHDSKVAQRAVREGGGDYRLTLLGRALGGCGRRRELGGGVGHSVIWLSPVPVAPLLRQRQDLLQRLGGTGACGHFQEVEQN